MPRAPARFNNASEEDRYFGTDAGTWNTPFMPPYQGLAPAPPTGTNFGQLAANQHQFQIAQVSGQMPPPPFIPPQLSYKHYPGPLYNNIPPVTQIDTRPPDYWHSDTHLLCVNRGREAEYPYSVSFRPTSGPCTRGVAMLNLERGQGMVDPHMPLDACVPPEMARFADGALLIDWPGYRQASYILALRDPRTGRHATRAMLGAQVTQHFKDFVNTRTEAHFHDADGAMRVGIDGVVYDQVRVAELYTKDGMVYRPQFGLNAHFLAIT